MPLTDDGARRLAAELEHAHEIVDPPRSAWLFDTVRMREVRAVVYGRRPGGPGRVLVVRHDPGPVDRVEWVCEPFVRLRSE